MSEITDIYIRMRKSLANRRFCYNFSINRLRDKNITLLSNCCVGGLLYHNFGLQFLSPTINLNIPFVDFLKYCNNLLEYKDKPVVECSPLIEEFHELGGQGVTFPCGKCGDIRILFQHYQTFDEARQKWEMRSQRINFDNIVVVFLSWGNISIGLLDEFKKIPYKKVMFTDQWEIVDKKQIIYLNPPEGMHWFDRDSTRSKYHDRYYYDKFDWVKFLNS